MDGLWSFTSAIDQTVPAHDVVQRRTSRRSTQCAALHHARVKMKVVPLLPLLMRTLSLR